MRGSIFLFYWMAVAVSLLGLSGAGNLGTAVARAQEHESVGPGENKDSRNTSPTNPEEDAESPVDPYDDGGVVKKDEGGQQDSSKVRNSIPPDKLQELFQKRKE